MDKVETSFFNLKLQTKGQNGDFAANECPVFTRSTVELQTEISSNPESQVTWIVYE